MRVVDLKSILQNPSIQMQNGLYLGWTNSSMDQSLGVTQVHFKMMLHVLLKGTLLVCISHIH